MGDSPPGTPSPPPPHQPLQSQELDSQNPNPISDSGSEDPSQNPLPSTSEIQTPPPTNPVDEQSQPEEEPHILVEDQDPQDEPDPDPESEHLEAEGMSINSSPRSHPSVSETLYIADEIKGNHPPTSSVRRTTKRKKGSKNHVSQVASERKMQQLFQCFNPIPFVPGKTLDFAKHEELLKKVGLWDFAHVEFDRNIRVDLVGKLIVNYNVRNRGSYVNGLKIGVSRADLGRAFKLPKKLDCDGEVFPSEFLSFLEEFVSNWMLLHGEELWCTPSEIVAWLKMIQEGIPHKVDWAGLIWYMMEKELAQRTNLKDCYYASHLQHVIKVQKEELFRDSLSFKTDNPKLEVEILKETVAVEEEDDDGGDVKMMDIEDSGIAEQKLKEQNVELKLGQDGDAQVVTIDTQVENVDAQAETVETQVKTVDAQLKNGDAQVKNGDTQEEKDSDCHADETEKFDDADETEKFDDADEKKEGHDVGNSEDVDEANEVESLVGKNLFVDVDNSENRREENKDVEMIEFGNYEEEEERGQGQGQGPGQWLLDGKFEGHQLLHRCSMGEVNASEDGRLEDATEDVEDDEIEEDGHVEGFKIMTKGSLDAMTSANLMQPFEPGQLPFSSLDHRGQSSLNLISPRADNNVMLGGPSMYNHAGKREMDHEHDISHQGLNDTHKRMRVEGSWDNKPFDFDICIEHAQQWLGKAKMTHIADMQDACNQVSVAQEFCGQQLTQKESEIAEFRYKLEDLQRSKRMEVDRLNRELYLMSSVIDGYKRALKHTQQTFSDYRKRCQVPDEPIYKDVGLGGVVKSVMELERERLKKEDDNKMACNFIEELIQKILHDFVVRWDDEVLVKVQSHCGRLMGAVKDIEHLKVDLVKGKSPIIDVDAAKEIEPLKGDLIKHATPATVMDAAMEIQPLKDDLMKHRTPENAMDAAKEMETLKDGHIEHRTPAIVENAPSTSCV